MRVLIAIDTDPSSLDAIDMATELLTPDVEAIVLNVADPNPPALSAVGLLADQRSQARASGADTALLEQSSLVTRGAAAAIDAAHTVVLVGDPATRIVEAATQFEVDMIIVGTRDKGPVHRFFTGSVSRQVLAHAPCSVLVAR